jgi:hypothetical protein
MPELNSLIFILAVLWLVMLGLGVILQVVTLKQVLRFLVFAAALSIFLWLLQTSPWLGQLIVSGLFLWCAYLVSRRGRSSKR